MSVDWLSLMKLETRLWGFASHFKNYLHILAWQDRSLVLWLMTVSSSQVVLSSKLDSNFRSTTWFNWPRFASSKKMINWNINRSSEKLEAELGSDRSKLIFTDPLRSRLLPSQKNRFIYFVHFFVVSLPHHHDVVGGLSLKRKGVCASVWVRVCGVCVGACMRARGMERARKREKEACVCRNVRGKRE